MNPTITIIRRVATGITILVFSIGLIALAVYYGIFAPAEPSVSPETPSAAIVPAQDQCGLTVASPLPLAMVGTTFTVEGTLSMATTQPCRWIVFEGQAGRIEVINPTTGTLVVPPIPLAVAGDWMEIAMEGGTLSFAVPVTLPSEYTGPANIVLIEDDPSGESEVINTLFLAVIIE